MLSVTLSQMILMIFNFNFITKIQGQGKVIGILTMHLGKLPSHRFCSVSKRFVNKKQGPINLNTINTRILDICLFIKTEWKDIKERMKTIVKRSLVWLYKILNVRMINEEAREKICKKEAGRFCRVSFALFCKYQKNIPTSIQHVPLNYKFTPTLPSKH